MYNTENVRKSVIAGRFSRTLKNKIYEDMKIFLIISRYLHEYTSDVNRIRVKIKLEIMWKCHNTRRFFEKVLFVIGNETYSPTNYGIKCLNGSNMKGTVYHQELSKLSRDFGIGKVLKRKAGKLQ